MSSIYSCGPVPAGLRTEEFILRPIVAGDAEKDHGAVMETREHLRLWERSSWPEDDFTVEANREDLLELEKRHTDHRAFTYTVLSPDRTECLGCVYIFPTGASFLAKSTVTPVGHDKWAAVDVVVYFWVRQTQMEKGLDKRLLAALRGWFAQEWMADTAVFVTNEKFTQQVDLFHRTDLNVKFELVEPGKPGKYLIFG
ncbi:N-acetyltransferase [Paenarthrobacter sp. Z7-10]|uniref:N-acetyltransferase n=1 Tax=Paenarthrobacter sp. Z7-10 TaxID=2787635 RepID=UPI0022A97490|nr:N-acetyltransferase [Paenarthrobacter sp. Z7-10]MCZ2403428.1 N-acetyltransferase [Paenarthrobacter sp. Z7-10]